jgi:hypothetical protein
VIDVIMDPDFALSSNSFVWWIGIINTLVNHLVPIQILCLLRILGCFNVKLIVSGIEVIPCRMNIWISFIVNRGNMDIEFAVAQKVPYFILS